MNFNNLVFEPGNPLPSEKLNELICRAQSGDTEAREAAVRANLRLVMSVAKRFLSFDYELDDLFQIGCLGLFKAIDRFDPERGLKFSTYAVPLIIGEIRSFIRDDGPVKVSRGLKERYLKLNSLRQRYQAENGEEPTLEKLAELSGLSPEEVVATLDSGNKPVSLNEVIYAADGKPVCREETLAATENDVDLVTDRVSLTKVLDSLPQRERQILLLRYLQDYSQTQIAERFGISQVHVSRLLKKAIRQVQEALNS
ncbi:MAG: SigB/SigF/SigG family RNA polymerase sigma factor [Firmicutes bacterium]|nr:SigB/SigF/SigG family RNA polymerase sigma factor [Bacillota bacterium]